VAETTEPVARVEFYRDGADEWRWRARAFNNEIVATSGEGYKNRGDAEGEAKKLFGDVVESDLEPS
jgi:uncharacterized protein YegP (UPF0339 family)